MTNELAQLDNQTLFSLVTNGDCSRLTDDQKLAYYKARCDAAGLDPRAQPFQFLNLKGKLVLYALKGCTDQLASKHGIVCEIVEQRTEEGIRIVTVRARAKDGRQTDEIGAVQVGGIKGDDLCNAYMKAVTKAKRRATLSICGLGMMDETEIETIKDAQPVQVVAPPPKPIKPAPVKPAPSTAEDVRTSELLIAPDADGMVDPSFGIAEGETIKLDGHVCAVCSACEWMVRKASPQSKNPGRLYLACAAGCKDPKNQKYPSMGGFVDDVMPKYAANAAGRESK